MSGFPWLGPRARRAWLTSRARRLARQLDDVARPREWRARRLERLRRINVELGTRPRTIADDELDTRRREEWAAVYAAATAPPPAQAPGPRTYVWCEACEQLVVLEGRECPRDEVVGRCVRWPAEP